MIVHGEVAPARAVQQALWPLRPARRRGAAFASLSGHQMVDIGGVADVKRSGVDPQPSPSCTRSKESPPSRHLSLIAGARSRRPVVSYCPSSDEGKQNIAGAWLLTTVPSLRSNAGSLAKSAAWNRLIAWRQHPLWTGTTYGYHALTYGWLVARSSASHRSQLCRSWPRYHRPWTGL